MDAAAPTSTSPSGVLRRNVALSPEARYKALVGIMPDVIVCAFDETGRVLTLEGGALDKLPVPVSSLIGRPLDEFLSAEHVAEVVRGEHVTFESDGANGVTWWVQSVPMVDDEGRLCGGMMKWRDITARVAVERELKRSNAELEQFAYVASHDLSEPLRMINGYLKLLERRHGDALPPDAQEFVGFAVDGAQRMRGLIDDLLTFSRIGRDEEVAHAVDVQALVESTWRTLTAEREGPEATLLATGLPVVIGDPGLLGQLFQNLLANALKFVRPGHAPVVEVRADPLPAGGWSFTVDDEGIGFDGTQAERIFRVFQRLHTRDEYPGTGVGLAIARKVVECHHGRIWAEPRPGGGARFRFDLPAA